jgi:hypothetical protein
MTHLDAPRKLVFDADQPRAPAALMLGPAAGYAVCEIDLGSVGLALRLAQNRRHRDGHERRLPGSRAAGAAGLHREVGSRVAGDDQHADPSEKEGKTTLTNTVLYPSKEARDATTDRDEGWRDPELRATRRVFANDGETLNLNSNESTICKDHPFLWFDSNAEEATNFYIATSRMRSCWASCRDPTGSDGTTFQIEGSSSTP